jgi:hypothetical protein
MCVEKKLGVCWGLAGKISPAFELGIGFIFIHQGFVCVCEWLRM